MTFAIADKEYSEDVVSEVIPKKEGINNFLSLKFNLRETRKRYRSGRSKA